MPARQRLLDAPARGRLLRAGIGDAPRAQRRRTGPDGFLALRDILELLAKQQRDEPRLRTSPPRPARGPRSRRATRRRRAWSLDRDTTHWLFSTTSAHSVSATLSSPSAAGCQFCVGGSNTAIELLHTLRRSDRRGRGPGRAPPAWYMRLDVVLVEEHTDVVRAVHRSDWHVGTFAFAGHRIRQRVRRT